MGSPFVVVLHEFTDEIVEGYNTKDNRQSEVKQGTAIIFFVVTLFSANEIKNYDKHEHERHGNVKGEEV